jgi:hypothetical protein
LAAWCCENGKRKPDLKIMTPDKIIITLIPVKKLNISADYGRGYSILLAQYLIFYGHVRR